MHNFHTNTSVLKCHRLLDRVRNALKHCVSFSLPKCCLSSLFKGDSYVQTCAVQGQPEWVPSLAGYLQKSLNLGTEHQSLASGASASQLVGSWQQIAVSDEISVGGASATQPVRNFQQQPILVSASTIPSGKAASKAKLDLEDCENSLHRFQVSSDDQPPQKRAILSNIYHHAEQ